MDINPNINQSHAKQNFLNEHGSRLKRSDVFWVENIEVSGHKGNPFPGHLVADLVDDKVYKITYLGNESTEEGKAQVLEKIARLEGVEAQDTKPVKENKETKKDEK